MKGKHNQDHFIKYDYSLTNLSLTFVTSPRPDKEKTCFKLAVIAVHLHVLQLSTRKHQNDILNTKRIHVQTIFLTLFRPSLLCRQLRLH